MNVKRTLAAVVLGAGITAGSVACGSTQHHTPAVTPNQAAAWALGNQSLLSAAQDALNQGDIDQGVHDFDAIPVPPVDPADWQQAVTDIDKARDAYDRGDLVAANNYATGFQDDVTAWTTAVQVFTAQ